MVVKFPDILLFNAVISVSSALMKRRILRSNAFIISFPNPRAGTFLIHFVMPALGFEKAFEIARSGRCQGFGLNPEATNLDNEKKRSGL